MRKKFSNKKSIKNKFLNYINYVKKNPMEAFRDVIYDIKLYIETNLFFVFFVIINVLNALLLRYLTMGGVQNIIAFQPLLADLAFVSAVGGLGYFFKHKNRIIYWFGLTIIFTLICMINSSYYTFYTSYASISLLSTAKQITGVTDAVTDSVVQLKDFTYLIFPLALLFIYYRLKKKKYFVTKEALIKEPKKAFTTVGFGAICFLIFCSTLNATDWSRIAKQWNREYVVAKYGIYVYHVNDLIKSIEPKLTSLFGYDEALRNFNEYFDARKDAKTNKYTNIYKDKNIITIHAESLQTFVINLEINGVEVTPNLNKLVRDSLYFSNFYSQVSIGTSSDSEFTYSTSLMPSNTGTAFVSYFDRTYVTMQKLLKEQGYYTFAMHGNSADYWNRRTMYNTLGYDHFYSKTDYDVSEQIGLGISDKSFFKQSAEKIEQIKKDHDKFYGTAIMLTNHTPFYDVDEYSNTVLDLTMKVKEEVDGETKEVSYPYLDGTKLGRYLKSVHYADEALGEFINDLDERGILDDTVIVIYGDHDARLPKDDYIKMYNYDYKIDGIKDEDDEGYIEFGSYQYELNRKVPLIIYSKDKKYKREVTSVMGMYDVLPTLGNMFGFKNEYALGQDIFNNLKDNIVVFPTGNWLTDKVYYNAQKEEQFMLKEKTVLPEDYIAEKNEYAEKLLNVSNSIIVYNLLDNTNETRRNTNESEIVEGAK